MGRPKLLLALVDWSKEIGVRRNHCSATGQSRIRLATPTVGTNTISHGLTLISLCWGNGFSVSSLKCQWLPGHIG